MGKYILKSTIGAIANGINNLIKEEKITKTDKLIIYGLDRYSYAMRTILSNLGYCNIESYISEDEAAVFEQIRNINDFSSHYLNSKEHLIDVKTVEERLGVYDNTVKILVATPNYIAIKDIFERLYYVENQHFFCIYDFSEPDINNKILGKEQLELAEIKQIEKDILKEIDKFCCNKKLRYWVAGGTLLGTIRHKGFIPWDDDIDIFLPWEDYLTFIREFKSNNNLDLFGFGVNKENDFPDPFVKVGVKGTILIEDIGTIKKIYPICIDVFPLVGLPEDKNERRAFFAGYSELNRSIWQDFYSNNGDVSVFGRWYYKQMQYLSTYDFDKSIYVGTLGSAYGAKDYASHKSYEETLRLPFEDIEVNVPIGYKEYLSNMYGDNWMELPPVEKRKTHHNFDVYGL